MNIKKRGFKQRLCLLLMVGVMTGCVGENASVEDNGVTPKQQYPDGRIVFYKKDSNGTVPASCNSLDFVTRVTKLLDVSGCGDNEVYFFELESVPSATTFTLCSDGRNQNTEYTIRQRCFDREVSDWYFTMKTTKVVTDTVPIRISDLKGIDSGSFVKPGVMMVENRYMNGNIDGKLSAVIIDRSPDL